MLSSCDDFTRVGKRPMITTLRHILQRSRILPPSADELRPGTAIVFAVICYPVAGLNRTTYVDLEPPCPPC